MNIKRFSYTRWMISPVEMIAIVVIILITSGGIFASVEDAIQLEQAINLNLSEAVIVNQGIVNLQREVLLTHAQVLREMGNLNGPPQPISRFVFAQIQITNLVSETNVPTVKYIFKQDDLALIRYLEVGAPVIDLLIKNLEKADTAEKRLAALTTLDDRLTTMEAQIKQLIDLHAQKQRDAIITTRNSLRVSQTTSVVSGIVLLLMALVLALVVRRSLISRLDQAVEADRLKSQLLTSVSHELRTPINAIQGYSQLLVEDAYGEMTSEQKTTIQRVQLNTTQLQGMVNNLLDRAQLEQGRLALRNAPFSPADFLETTHSALSILASSKGLELTSEIAPDVPAMINGDVLRLQQILFNLTSNALKFTEKGSVHAKIFLPDATHWALAVSDTGIGIAPEAQANVFAAFWQVDSSATRKYRGSGLGLSIVKQLAELMGATVTLTSELGKGTTFTVTFPLEVK